jgi:hypothetical protein
MVLATPVAFEGHRVLALGLQAVKPAHLAPVA